MNNIDLFRMGIQNLWRRKLRTFLTVLGVIIGTSSIIIMLSLGFGMSESFEEQLAQWGSLTTINVYKGWSEIPGKKVPDLDDKAVASFKTFPNVIAVSPAVQTYGMIINGRYITNTQIKGIDPDTMEAFGFETAEGRLLNSSDDMAVVFGADVPLNFYNPKSRVWKEPKLNIMRDRMTLFLDEGYRSSLPGENKSKPKEYKFETVGILTPGDDWETNYSIYMPIDQVQKLIKEKEKAENQGQGQQSGRKKEAGYNQVTVKVNDMKNVQDVQKIIKELGHETSSLNDQLESMKKQSAVIQAVLGGIGAISLLVAAIGITNTMVMSIYERTKEIGVMKVIGASLNDIKRLFLFESALIGFLGGIFGVGFSYLLSFLANKFGGQFGDIMGMGGGEATKISIIPIWLVFAAMGFSALIGVISGYFPAKRAMNLSALEAIRTE